MFYSDLSYFYIPRAVSCFLNVPFLKNMSFFYCIFTRSFLSSWSSLKVFLCFGKCSCPLSPPFILLFWYLCFMWGDDGDTVLLIPIQGRRPVKADLTRGCVCVYACDRARVCEDGAYPQGGCCRVMRWPAGTWGRTPPPFEPPEVFWVAQAVSQAGLFMPWLPVFRGEGWGLRVGYADVTLSVASSSCFFLPALRSTLCACGGLLFMTHAISYV